MEVTKATVAILAAACVTAGAAGGYIITRDPLPAADAESAVDPVSEPFNTPAVEHSEGVVTGDANPSAGRSGRGTSPCSAAPTAGAAAGTGAAKRRDERSSAIAIRAPHAGSRSPAAGRRAGAARRGTCASGHRARTAGVSRARSCRATP